MIYAAYGFIYNFFEDTQIHNIKQMQVRLSVEFFPEFRKKEADKYLLLYLPKVEITDLKNNKLEGE